MDGAGDNKDRKDQAMDDDRKDQAMDDDAGDVKDPQEVPPGTISEKKLAALLTVAKGLASLKRYCNEGNKKVTEEEIKAIEAKIKRAEKTEKDSTHGFQKRQATTEVNNGYKQLREIDCFALPRFIRKKDIKEQPKGALNLELHPHDTAVSMLIATLLGETRIGVINQLVVTTRTGNNNKQEEDIKTAVWEIVKQYFEHSTKENNDGSSSITADLLKDEKFIRNYKVPAPKSQEAKSQEEQ